ncbi:MAG: CAP domain-containing protein [Planctomycetota bacterium]
MPWLPPAKPEPKGSPAARAFMAALRSPECSAEQRREAWTALQAEDERPPAAVAKVVDKARRAAWQRLDALILARPVRRTAARLPKAMAPHQAKALAVIRGDGFSREKLDQAMAPIQQALEEARAPLAEAEPYTAIRARIDEVEAYAVGCGLRPGWSDELRDALCTLRFVVRYAGTADARDVVDSNHTIGSWIDPGEHACIARLNWHRVLLGLSPLHIDLRLVIAAKKHSEEMVAKGYFSHASPTPHLKGFGQRARREHTGARGECIAGGQSHGVGAFRAWYYSQGHHKIMVGSGRAVGVGRAGRTWTLMMGGSKMKGSRAVTMARYVRRRYQAGDDTEKLFALARWCADQGLLTQAQDELERILVLDSDHERARQVLERMRGDAPSREPQQ